MIAESAEDLEAAELTAAAFGRETPLGGLLHHPRLLAAGGLLCLLVVASLLAPWLAPYDPLAAHPASALEGPTVSHLLGTDSLGRDVLSRVLWGGRISLPVAILTPLAGLLVGGGLGRVSGYWGGVLDLLAMRFVDALLAFPSLILAIALVAALGPGVINAMIAITIVQIPIYARVTRAMALQIKAADYVVAGRALGAGPVHIILRHLLPNMLSPLLVQISLSAAFAIITEATLSYLGLGAQPPTPDWGYMMNEGAQYISNGYWWLELGPAIAICLAVFGFNWLGDALRDLLDPTLHR
jgi:ABC-type dipeptide/oligopeptide/nickel transport system permease subunit